MRNNLTVYAPNFQAMRDLEFKFQIFTITETQRDKDLGIPGNIDENELMHCIQLIEDPCCNVTEEFDTVARSVFSKAKTYWNMASDMIEEYDAWVDTIDKAIACSPRSDIGLLFGTYDNFLNLYFLGVTHKENAMSGDSPETIPMNTYSLSIVTNRRGESLKYSRLKDRFEFKQVMPLPCVKALMPFAAAGCLHAEIRDLDEIEALHNGICLKEYFKSADESRPEGFTQFETMESTYVKSAIKELLANNPNFERVRIYEELGTPERNELEEQLKDYTIPDDILKIRNGDSNFPDIDKFGKYIDNPKNSTSDNNDVPYKPKKDPSIFKKEDC